MKALDAIIATLDAQPALVRCKFTIQRDGRQAIIHRGAMQASVQELDDGTVEANYEHSLHEVTRVRVSPDLAAQLLLAVIMRDRLARIEVPDAGWPSQLL